MKNGCSTKSTRFHEADDDEDLDNNDDDEVEEEDEEDDGFDEKEIKKFLAAKKKQTSASRASLTTAINKQNVSTRAALLAAKKEAEAEIRNVMERIDVLLQSDPTPTLNPMLDLIGSRNNAAEAVQALYANVIDKLSADKDMALEATDNLVQEQAKQRRKRFKEIIDKAHGALDEGQMNQKVLEMAQHRFLVCCFLGSEMAVCRLSV
ncbi:hypothetical protein DACRYDRAFT_13847 [Dacryopinax primogenitus]|uniref:Uncharacterized protein n=1 Tax=Dacryopinax primogenitus (strain DJM 731) TaxID=1858805 RepID=M5G7B2_DACPD|nr:uncharacterized protein DACRYDRAFT_13847 [Dacryopinax primogenitus]EJU04624.1 hypothetical protein DACRYDRAFT_13847 [Dacryopinax primogenitus]